MAKKVKDKWLGARVDADVDTRVKEYTEAAEMDMGELVRKGVEEYMLNHPVKQAGSKDRTDPSIKALAGKE